MCQMALKPLEIQHLFLLSQGIVQTLLNKAICVVHQTFLSLFNHDLCLPKVQCTEKGFTYFHLVSYEGWFHYWLAQGLYLPQSQTLQMVYFSQS